MIPLAVVAAWIVLAAAVVAWRPREEDRQLSDTLVSLFESARWAECAADLDKAHAAAFNMLTAATRPSIALRAAAILRYVDGKRKYMPA